MTNHIILTTNQSSADALEQFLLLTWPQYRLTSEPEVRRRPVKVVWDSSRLDITAFRRLADEIEAAANLRDTTPCAELAVLVDRVDFERLNPLAVAGWDSIVALLILAFPECRWAFGVARAPATEEGASLVERHSLKSLTCPAIEPLFDPTGLREWVKGKARLVQEGHAAYLPIRSTAAAAIDDERTYAYFHAYAAYRFGFRAYALADENALRMVLAPSPAAFESDLRLTIEDVYLGFPDRDDRKKTVWSDFRERDNALPALGDVRVLRVFVTSGHQKLASSEKNERNEAFRDALKVQGRLGRRLFKPMAGIFELWKASGLTRRLRSGRQRGQADGFVWPPTRDGSPLVEDGHDHSAPGRLLEVATRLASRASSMLAGPPSVLGAVRGAVLATDAVELLGKKAPTTSLEALALKHEFEVIAECQFYGVHTQLDVAERVEDIQLEIEELGHYFHPTRRREAKWNAEAALLDSLLQVYQAHNQFDEEVALQVRSRALHRRLWFKRRMRVFGDQLRWANPLYWCACYFHGLLRSIPMFVLALLAWIGVLTALFTLTGEAGQPLAMRQGLEGAVSSFFSVGSPVHHDSIDLTAERLVRDDAASEPRDAIVALDRRVQQLERGRSPNGKGYVAVICLAILAGFVHVGVFISHVYTIASRR